eukprot:CAMPEP_0206263446 /NCGR_PEP_ID=MMETSP0047_2-20121206/28822_1 /ASSEMBLY_ACC=CAM_ASM_000192 /TAXON_ID=195065 /ORGANISM="Chroomonas mesostigmatica_cf, Strain CCMP1168" /LENGTH=73 /DNA_ID=CAMNT_0053690987 /DNA_START=1 /DNA_END=219 /DNA_ORIENTATION=+
MEVGAGAEEEHFLTIRPSERSKVPPPSEVSTLLQALGDAAELDKAKERGERRFAPLKRPKSKLYPNKVPPRTR